MEGHAAKKKHGAKKVEKLALFSPAPPRRTLGQAVKQMPSASRGFPNRKPFDLTRSLNSNILLLRSSHSGGLFSTALLHTTYHTNTLMFLSKCNGAHSVASSALLI